ncbi:hypothetical protein [Piscirickettsia litoralis]|uniref:Uncharacterized protein n=1 Tax=Piscirickettsia litoralis TaxID=1891921 RepID=A0ABX3A1Q9_9GAMM|nr:hypothetical protein [Piscirickettsia litoralis]ODN42792.1 hypothetical protein BGC07_07490 [Piscirickettsia litoralis]
MDNQSSPPRSPAWQELLGKASQVKALYENQEVVKAALYSEMLVNKLKNVNLFDYFEEELRDLVMVYVDSIFHKNQLEQEGRLNTRAYFKAQAICEQSPLGFIRGMNEGDLIGEPGQFKNTTSSVVDVPTQEEKPVMAAKKTKVETEAIADEQATSTDNSNTISFSGSFC